MIIVWTLSQNQRGVGNWSVFKLGWSNHVRALEIPLWAGFKGGLELGHCGLRKSSEWLLAVTQEGNDGVWGGMNWDSITIYPSLPASPV